MVGDVCLDKDGIRGAAVFAEMATALYSQGSTLYDHLQYFFFTLSVSLLFHYFVKLTNIYS